LHYSKSFPYIVKTLAAFAYRFSSPSDFSERPFVPDTIALQNPCLGIEIAVLESLRHDWKTAESNWYDLRRRAF